MSTPNRVAATQKSPESPKPRRPLILPGTTVGDAVGTFYADFTIRSRDKTESRVLSGLVDTGSAYTLVPAAILEELGVERLRTVRLRLADGSLRDFSLGNVEMELEGVTDFVHVIFGTDNDTVLLGALALEVFALAADARNQCLIPAQATL